MVDGVDVRLKVKFVLMRSKVHSCSLGSNIKAYEAEELRPPV